MNLLLIFVGGGLGSLARYGMNIAAKSMFASYFPLGTFLSNLLSCLVMGIVIWFYSGKEQDPVRILLITGFCGGFSTFSTYSFETLELFRAGHWGVAILNILLSTVVCISVIWLFTKSAIR